MTFLLKPTPDQYAAIGADLDGANHYLTRGGGLTGANDSIQGLVSFWFRHDGGNGAELNVLFGGVGEVNIYRNAANKWRVDLFNSGASVSRIYTSTNTFLSGGGWHHFLCSWSYQAPDIEQLYIDGLDEWNLTAGTTTTIDWTLSNWGVGGHVDGSQKFNGCLADLWATSGIRFDASLAENMAWFRDGEGRPTDLGTNGLVKGTQPLIWLRGPASAWGANGGSGGNFTQNGGTPGTPSTSPSAP